MTLLLLIGCGALLGWVAQRRLPALRRMGMRMAVGLGAAGALIGGFLTCAAARWSIGDVHVACVVGSAVGACAVLLVSSRVLPRRIAS